MNKEMYTVIGVGVALAALQMTSQANLRADIRAEHGEIRAEIADVRTEMRSGQAALELEIAGIRAELTDIRADIRQLGERVARIEVRLDIPSSEPSTEGR